MWLENGEMRFASPAEPLHSVRSGVWGCEWTFENSVRLSELGVPCISPMARDYRYPCKGITPYAFQIQGADFLARTRRGYMLADMGCVDAETEYLSPTGWKRISEYSGGEVAQYDALTGCQNWVLPSRYIAQPCDMMYHFKTSRGVDQMLSPEHKVLYKQNGKQRTALACEIAETHRANRYGWRGRLPTTFTGCGGEGLGLDSAKLRVMVAVLADGHFPNKSARAVIRVVKPRKIARLRKLLMDAGIPYSERPTQPEGYVRFCFDAPRRAKTYEGFWQASAEQLAVIVDEATHWDGTAGKGNRGAAYYSRHKADADFIQYAFHACGYTAFRSSYTREDGNVDYAVKARGPKADSWLECRGFSSEGDKLTTIREVVPAGRMKYCFTVPSGFLVLRRNGCVFVTGNCGKTLMSLWAFDYLLSIGAVKKALVICPKNIVFSAWADEIKTHLPHLRFSAVIGSSAQKERALNKRADIYIINHDGVHYELDLLLQHKFCIVIYDESSAIGDTTAMRHKAVRKLLTPHTYFWEATGTPTSQSPMSAHGQIRLMANVDQTGKTFRPHLDAQQPFFTKTAWKSLTMVQESQYSWRPRKNSNELVFKYMQPAFRVSKAQVLKDIKEPVMLRRDVGLSAEQIKAIKALELERVHYTEQGSVTAVNAAVLMSKIIQIACGCAYGIVDGEAGENDGEGRGLVEFSAKPKEDALLEMLENSEHGKLVYVPYRAPLERVAAVCRKAGYRTVTVTGATRPREFGEIMRAFQARSKTAPDVIVAIPQKMSHGVTATAADLTVWYAPVLRAEVFSQANNRMNRIGQDKFTRIGTIAANDLERKLYDRLTAMNLNESSLLSMYETVMTKGIL